MSAGSLTEHFPLHFQTLYHSLSISEGKYHFDSRLIFHKEIHAAFFVDNMEMVALVLFLEGLQPRKLLVVPSPRSPSVIS